MHSGRHMQLAKKMLSVTKSSASSIINCQQVTAHESQCYVDYIILLLANIGLFIHFCLDSRYLALSLTECHRIIIIFACLISRSYKNCLWCHLLWVTTHWFQLLYNLSYANVTTAESRGSWDPNPWSTFDQRWDRGILYSTHFYTDSIGQFSQRRS